MQQPQAQFITLEGGEGTGKTTNVKFIANLLSQAQIPFVCTREPGGTHLGELLRETLLQPQQPAPSPLTELLILFAARNQHLDQLIRPSLAAGTWVICDRFTDASYAYQISGRGQPAQQLASLENLVHADLQPNLTFLLDMPASASEERLEKRGAVKDRIEQEAQDFFERVRLGYLERAKTYASRFKVLDASQNLEQVQAQIQQHLQPLIQAYTTTKQALG